MEPAASFREQPISPPGRWSALHLGELWHYRDLLYILAWRDVKVRYKQAVLGAAWAVIQPLVMMAIFTLIFSRVAKLDTGDVPYPIFAYVGLIPWTLFASGVSGAGASLVGNSNLVSKVFFPRLVIPVSATLTWVPDFLISSAILFVLMAWFHYVPQWTVILLPVIMVAAIVSALSVGVWVSALNVAYRDVAYAIPFLIQVWLFLTPVAYPATSVPPALRWVTGLNPMTWVIEFARWAITGTPMPAVVSVISIATTTVLLVSGLYYFRKVEHFFADVI
jgi:lipopolysaccharide transport system permease protein